MQKKKGTLNDTIAKLHRVYTAAPCLSFFFLSSLFSIVITRKSKATLLKQKGRRAFTTKFRRDGDDDGDNDGGPDLLEGPVAQPAVPAVVVAAART